MEAAGNLLLKERVTTERKRLPACKRVEYALPRLQRYRHGVALLEDAPRCLAHFQARLLIGMHRPDRRGEAARVPGSHAHARACRGDDGRGLAFRVADEDRGTARGHDSVELAGMDESFEAGLENREMDVRHAQAPAQHFAMLVGL